MKKNTQIRIEETMYEKLKFIAEKQNRSINGQMIHAIEKMIEDYERVNGKIEPPNLR